MKFLKAIYWRLFIIRLSLRWLWRPNLMDEVVYKGEVWRLSQGVKSPVWTLRQGPGEGVEVHERDFRKVRTIANYWGSFRNGYQFYMRSWYDIWMREGIQPWMLGCRIWGRCRGITPEFTGVRGAQRSARPVERIVMPLPQKDYQWKQLSGGFLLEWDSALAC